jgi:hypothetical protein
MRNIACAGVLALFWLAGCAPGSSLPDVDSRLAAEEEKKQLALALADSQQRAMRLDRIARRLLVANRGLCGGRVAPLLDFRVYAPADVADRPHPEVYRKALGIGDGATVTALTQGGAAARAGLHKGDIIVAIDGKPPPDGNVGKWLIKRLHDDPAPLQLTVSRHGVNRDIAIAGEIACDYRVLLGADSSVNAFADGRNVVINRGMMTFATDDRDLALVAGHELAHNVLRHIEKKQGNALIGAILGGLVGAAIGIDMSRAGADIGAGAYSQEFEAEADYVGLYMTSRAGFDAANAAGFWRRMAVAHPRAIHQAEAGSHPSTARRFLAIEAAAQEIEARRSAGLALIPENFEPPPAFDDRQPESNRPE